MRRESRIWPIGLRGLGVVPVAVAAGLVAGWTVLIVLPWVVAAAVAVIAYLAVAMVGGLMSGAGIDVPLGKLTRKAGSS